jgi:thioredoxin-dependent peroxiredoxin
MAIRKASSKGRTAKHLAQNTAAEEGKTSSRRQQPCSGSRQLAPGMKAPAFTLPCDGGGTISLADFAGRKLVLYFYPRADTPGCTQEAIAFSRLKRSFARAGADVVGVSADPLRAQDAFKAKHGLTLTLASDEQHRMLEAYGIWQEKSLYGRRFMGVVRATFLIGSDQRIARVWPKVSVAGHAEEVLAAAKAL